MDGNLHALRTDLATAADDAMDGDDSNNSDNNGSDGGNESQEEGGHASPLSGLPLVVALPIILLIIILSVNVYRLKSRDQDPEEAWLREVRRQSLLSWRQGMRYRQTYQQDDDDEDDDANDHPRAGPEAGDGVMIDT